MTIRPPGSASKNDPSVQLVVGTAGVRPVYGELSSLASWGYADLCTVRTALPFTAEQWARALLGDTPDFAQRLIWHRLLGFQLIGTASADTVAGWQVGARDADWIRLETDSRLFRGNIIIRAAENHVSWATILQYRHAVSRVHWGWLSPIHRQLAPRMMQSTAAALAARQERST